MPNKKYVLITPARNEEAYIEKTIKAVISQTVLPQKWVIVSDGSTDRTDSIGADYADKWNFIELLRVNGDQQRNFGSKGRAFLRGYERLAGLQYEFIGNLDADISFDTDYFERLLAKFDQDSMLGIGGGFLYEEIDGRFAPRTINKKASVPNAVQLFKRECYERIGGFIPLKYGGEDWYADVMARSLGWRVESFPDITVYHLRLTNAADSQLKAAIRQGCLAYSLGSGFLFEMLKNVLRIRMKPYVLFAACRLAGFVKGYIEREDRAVSKEFVAFLRKEQNERIKKMLGFSK